MSSSDNDIKQPLNKNFREPKIRFKQYNGQWLENKIGELLDVKMCKRVFAEQTSENGEIPFYKIGTIGLKADAYISRDLFTYLKEKYNYPNFGEILITCSGTIGRCFQYEGEEAYYQDSNIVWIKNKGENAILNDLLYLIFQRQDWSKLNKSTIKRLFVDDLLKMRISYPVSRNEQIKISELFNKLSSLITATQEKCSALKKYKRGLQKMLYSTNIVSYKRLIDLVSFQPKSKYGAGSGINNGSYPFYLSGDKASFLNQYMFDGRYVIANDGGEANFKITNGKFSYSDHCICFKGHSDTMTNYIYNYLDMLKDKITYIGFVGSGLKNIDREYFETLEIPIASEKDIIKCVHIFTILDNYINGCLNRIDEIKLLRKYLLGNMFI